MSSTTPARRILPILLLALILAISLGAYRRWRLRPAERYALHCQLAAWLRDYALPGETVAAQELHLLRQLEGLPTRPLPTGDSAGLLAALQSTSPDFCVGVESIAWRTVRTHPWFQERYRPIHQLAAPGDPVTPLTVYAYTPSPFDVGSVATRTLGFANAPIFLTGYRLPSQRLTPGEPLPLTLYWQTVAWDNASRALTVRLADPDDGHVWGQQHTPPDVLATDAWPAGSRVATRHLLAVPADLPAGEYDLQLLLDPSLGKTPLSLTTVYRPVDIGDAPPVPDHPLTDTFTFGETEAIELMGYDAPTWSLPGSEVRVALYWHARRPVTVNYKVFVHLLTEDDRLLAQDDGLPVGWTYPTPRWQPGEYIRDEHRLTLLADAPRGDYRLVVGLYDADTGMRLPVRDAAGVEIGDRRLILTAIRVR